MRLLEIQRQLKKKRRFRQGKYVIEVKLDNPGDEAQEFLRVFVKEDGREVAKGLFKQWNKNSKWEPLSISAAYSKKKTMQEMMYRAAREAGYLL